MCVCVVCVVHVPFDVFSDGAFVSLSLLPAPQTPTMQDKFDKELDDAAARSRRHMVPMILEPVDPYNTGLTLILCDKRIRILSRAGKIYDVEVLRGKEEGVTQVMSHDGLTAQVQAAVAQFGFETKNAYLDSYLCQRETGKARAASLRPPASLPFAGGASGTAPPGRFKAEAVATAAKAGGSTGSGGSSAPDSSTKCDFCKTNFHKTFRLLQHTKRFPDGLCMEVQPPSKSTVAVFKTLAACLADATIQQNVSDNKTVASVIEGATITALSGMSTKSMMCQSCKSCKQNGGNCCCARPLPIYKWQARVEIDGMTEPTAMIWEALSAVVYEQTVHGDTILVKPSEAHFLTNTDHFAQICNVTFEMRIKLKKYVSKRDGETTTNVQVLTMTEIEE